MNSEMCTILWTAAFSNVVPVMGDTGFSRKSTGPHQVGMYWLHTRHMWPHSPPRIHFTPRRLASCVDLGVEALAHLVGDEPAEVAALGGVGAERVVQADMLEQQHVAHHGEGAGVGEVVAGGHDEEDLGALAVNGWAWC